MLKNQRSEILLVEIIEINYRRSSYDVERKDSKKDSKSKESVHGRFGISRMGEEMKGGGLEVIMYLKRRIRE